MQQPLIPPELWDRLRSTLRTSDALHAWLHRANAILGGRTPAEVIEAGQIEQVMIALQELEPRTSER